MVQCICNYIPASLPILLPFFFLPSLSFLSINSHLHLFLFPLLFPSSFSCILSSLLLYTLPRSLPVPTSPFRSPPLHHYISISPSHHLPLTISLHSPPPSLPPTFLSNPIKPNLWPPVLAPMAPPPLLVCDLRRQLHL